MYFHTQCSLSQILWGVLEYTLPQSLSFIEIRDKGLCTHNPGKNWAGLTGGEGVGKAITPQTP